MSWVALTLTIAPAGTAAPPRRTWTWAGVAPTPTPVRVALLPPAVPPEDGLMPLSTGALAREKPKGVAPETKAMTEYVPAVPLAAGVALTIPLAPIVTVDAPPWMPAPLAGPVKVTCPPTI